jgi:hypothetical protein
MMRHYVAIVYVIYGGVNAYAVGSVGVSSEMWTYARLFDARRQEW